LKLSRDGWGGLAVLAASLFLYALTLGLKDNPLVPIGPGYYPRIVLAITALLALAVLIGDLWTKKAPLHLSGTSATSGEKLNYAMVAAMFAVFGLYCGALPFLGFRLSTFIYVAVTNTMLEWPKGAQGWLRVLAVALITTVVVYFSFERYLAVLLPRGRWTDF
jgi:putative tricarboxylic transport membrane protein